jgi:hypothetical protein
MIIEDSLYLGGNEKLHVFKVASSLSEPLIPLRDIVTMKWVRKIIRAANELLLG